MAPAPLTHARHALDLPGRLAVDGVGLALGGVFGAVSALRGAKSLHPRGLTHAAEIEVPGAPDAAVAGSVLGRPGRHRAIVRFSRSLGLPDRLPDILGLSVRIPDAGGPGAHQDILLVTSADAPVGHHLFVPTRDPQGRAYSSSLPFRAGDGPRLLLGALPDPSSPRPDGPDPGTRIRRAAATGELRFRLAVAPLSGRFRPVATLHVGAPLTQDLEGLRYGPGNDGGGLCPDGPVNRVRDAVYPLSQRGWGGR